MSLVASVHLIGLLTIRQDRTKKPSNHHTYENKKTHGVSQDTPALQNYKNSFDHYQAFLTSKEGIEPGKAGRQQNVGEILKTLDARLSSIEEDHGKA